MKKGLKITLIVLCILVGIVVIDTFQAKIFNNSTVLKIREEHGIGNTYYIDKGILVDHYYCPNKEEKTLFKGVKYTCPIDNSNKVKKYSKKIDKVILELNIPEEWDYEEIVPNESDNFKFALMIYKDSKNRSATLYFYKEQPLLCITALKTEELKLDNGILATITYYSKREKWENIILNNLYPNTFLVNNSLDEEAASEVLSFIKTINITNI